MKIDRQRCILFTASHELVHMIREGSPEDFKALADFLVQNYAEQGVDVNDLIRKEMVKNTNLTPNEAYEEVIAESCESFLRDTHLNDKAQVMYQQNRSLWSRIREALKRIVDAIKNTYATAKPQSDEARITMRSDVKQLETAYDLWTKGIINAAENLRNMEKAADNGGAKLQARYSESADILNDFNIAEDKMSDYIHVQKNVYNTLLKDGFFDKSETVGSNIRRYRTDVNSESGMVIETSRKGIKETFSYNNYRALSKQLKLQKLAVIRSLPEIIQNGHMIADDVPNYHNDNSDVSFAYIQSEISLNGVPVSVKVDVRKSPQRNSFWVHSIVTNNNSTELDPSGATPDLGYKSLSAENNVPQITEKVKQQSRTDSDFDLSFGEDDDTIGDIFAKDYIKHSEDIGEVLKNISDIELDPKKVTSIVNRVIRGNLGEIDSYTRDLLSTEVQLALESVDRTKPEEVSNAMIAAVRKAINNATVENEYAKDNYNDFLSAFKGKRFYLTEEQIADLKEHDMTLGDFKNAMMGKFTVVKAENAERSEKLHKKTTTLLGGSFYVLASSYFHTPSPGHYLRHYRA